MSQRFDPKPTETPVVHGRKYKRHTGTYVGLIAYVIQDSPNKMLTFKQIMEKLSVFLTGDRKGLENNIRVCLSSNKCFVKMSKVVVLDAIEKARGLKSSNKPVDPDYPNAKRNFWKVDESSITPKMLRRHFRDIAEMFPGLPAKLENDTAKNSALPICTVEHEQSSSKFSSPFSIESLLKKDHSTQRSIAYVQDTFQYAVMSKGVQNVLNTNTWCNQYYASIKPTDIPSYTDCRRHSEHFMYRVAEERTVDGSWRTPQQRMDLTNENALMYSQQLYGHAVHTKLQSSNLYTYDFKKLRW